MVVDINAGCANAVKNDDGIFYGQDFPRSRTLSYRLSAYR
jgi:hypothetical protein